ncbi:hypothetical protein DVH24_017928 [Malus domestica]|uniref:Uncharacterized protein n=1 Tax=Malus domestica TaxID=3750 RepID=A0A498KER1_MALDO|nr:hypothetical protein DVH24_017928 [Malus domestica]
MRENRLRWFNGRLGTKPVHLELEAFGLARQMQPHDEIPNSVTFTNLRPARLGSRRLRKEIHAVTVRMGSASDYVCL